MLRTFDIVTATQALKGLTREGRILFACAVCERLLPRYYLFEKDAGWGNGAVMRQLLDTIWGYVIDGTLDSSEIPVMQKLVMETTPHSERFRLRTVSGAINTGSALYQTLELCRTGDPALAGSVAEIADATVDIEVRLLTDIPDSDPELRDLVLHHPAVQGELAKQAFDIAELHGRTGYDAVFVRGFRDMATTLEAPGNGRE